MSLAPARWRDIAFGCMVAVVIAAGSIKLSPDHGRAFASGTNILAYEPQATAPLAIDDIIELSGTVDGAQTAHVILRIDDARSSGYAQRYNEERMLPPGPFRWTLPAVGLPTPSGRRLEPSSITRLLLFPAAAGQPLVKAALTIRKAARLPRGARGYALGALDAPLPPGFERIGPSDARIERGRPQVIRRPAPDPLVANGLTGIERLRLPWPAERARITLWLEDPGEWELLPHALRRRVRVNGIDLVDVHQAPDEWLRDRYLRDAEKEHGDADDAWSAYGRSRGGAITHDVDVRDGAILIELAGETASALHLAGVLIEEAGSDAGRQFVEQERAAWYRGAWPVLPASTRGDLPGRTIVLRQEAPSQVAAPVELRTAPGMGLRLSFSVASDHAVEAPRLLVETPATTGKPWPATAWAGRYRLTRPVANATWLQRRDDMLTPAVQSLRLSPGQRRHYDIWIEVPADAPPGQWAGAVSIGGPAQAARIPFVIQVLDVRLPPPPKPAGYYLDEAPHSTWFKTDAGRRAATIDCDLALLKRLGLSGSAPALDTPLPKQDAFYSDVQRAVGAKLAQPMFAYAPAKRLLAAMGVDGSARRIAEIEQTDAVAGPIIWSVADEPGNPGEAHHNLRPWLAAIRKVAPTARLAAQLNNPGDAKLMGLFDVVLVNDGFGIDVEAIAAARAATRGKEVWLYNTSAPRATAGYWLWHSMATRYVQWHARMPTADPFDPTDGREGDVQMIYPALQACPLVPTIHRDLLDMADGVIDQRWLAWLDEQTNQQSAELRTSIAKLATRWKDARALTHSQLHEMRESIMNLTVNSR